MRSLRSLTNEIRLKQEIKHKYRSNRRKTSYLYMQDREEVVYDAFLPTNSSPLPLKHHMRTREIQKGNIYFLCHPDALKQKNIEGRLLGCQSVNSHHKKRARTHFGIVHVDTSLDNLVVESIDE